MEVNRDPGIMTFHCGITKKGDELVTNGGRVLINVCISNSLITAAAKATGACKNIKFDGCHFRKDIAHKAIPRYKMYFTIILHFYHVRRNNLFVVFQINIYFLSVMEMFVPYLIGNLKM